MRAPLTVCFVSVLAFSGLVFTGRRGAAVAWRGAVGWRFSRCGWGSSICRCGCCIGGRRIGLGLRRVIKHLEAVSACFAGAGNCLPSLIVVGNSLVFYGRSAIRDAVHAASCRDPLGFLRPLSQADSAAYCCPGRRQYRDMPSPPK
jgi:hypothetical protein